MNKKHCKCGNPINGWEPMCRQCSILMSDFIHNKTVRMKKFKFENKYFNSERSAIAYWRKVHGNRLPKIYQFIVEYNPEGRIALHRFNCEKCSCRIEKNPNLTDDYKILCERCFE